MYASNPYGAAVHGISAKAASASVAPDKPRDAVLSRVAKRPQIPKPPVKFSMAPRYRFALPDPPTDLKMLRGSLETTAAPASVVHKLELDAKKLLMPLHPAFSLQADLVLPAQYAPRTESDHVSPEDQIILSQAEPVGLAADASKTPGGKGNVGSTTGLATSGRKPGSAPRLPPSAPANRAKQATAFPWMRRMAYDEYASGTTTVRQNSLAGNSSKDAKADRDKLDRAALQQKQDAINSFQRANRKDIKHPNKAKSHLTVSSIVSVFPDVNDVHTELISMQFDRVAPMDNVPRFAGKTELSEQAFQSAVTVSVADATNKKFLACYVPDEFTLEGLRDKGESLGTSERHERLREFSIRDAGVHHNAGRSSVQPCASARPKRTFIMTIHGEGKDQVVSLSAVSSAFLLAPRGAMMEALGKPALDLSREPDTQQARRARDDKVVDLVTSKKLKR
jgi:Paf1